MATHDLGHTLTDKKLRDLERRITRLYAQAGRELQETIDAYFEQFAKRDEEMRALIGEIVNGKEWTEQDYKQWRLAQIGRGERYQALRERIAQRMTNANAVAIAYINDETPGIYSLNRNYAAYTIEQVAGNVGFDLWDEQTARRLIVEQPELMPNYPPARALRRGIDLAYGRRQITASVTSSILQGRSLRGIADDLQQRITTMDRTSAIRTARTAFTGAQNAGRMDSYAAAERMGIKLKKEWLATLDGRTRHSHAALDGEKVGTDEKFSNGCRFPGDPQGRPGEVYNCRCTMVAALDDVDTSGALRRARDPETGESVLIRNMTYKEWEAAKGAVSRASDVSRQYRESAKPKTGKLRFEDGYKQGAHKREIDIAHHIWGTFGGDITLLKESNTNGVKTPDYLWNKKLWELKSISTEKAADSAVRSALKQIKGNPGGVILQCAAGIDTNKLLHVVDMRALRKADFRFDVLAISENGSVLFARRYKK